MYRNRKKDSMKTSDRVNFMKSLETAQARKIDAQLVDKFVDALIHKGYCFSRPAPSWCIGTKPRSDARVQMEWDNNNVHLVRLGKLEGHNSFALEPDSSLMLITEEDIPLVVNAFERLFHG
jgi:hypothetical protein